MNVDETFCNLAVYRVKINTADTTSRPMVFFASLYRHCVSLVGIHRHANDRSLPEDRVGLDLAGESERNRMICAMGPQKGF